MPSRSPFGARMQWPEPAHTEQSLARLACPTKGGAVRIRIALATAIAVIALPAIFFAVFTSTSAASARLTRHEASSHSRAVKIDDTLMSYSQARQVAKMVAYSNAVELGQEETYLTEVAYLKSVAVADYQVACGAASGCSRASSSSASGGGTGPSRCGSDAGDAGASDAGARGDAGWRGLRCHQHQHGRLGLHPSARVKRQLRRGQRRRVPVRVRNVDRTHGAAFARRGLPAGGTGCRRPQALFTARLGAVEHPLRLRAVTNQL